MSKSFRERRFKSPDFDITVYITGIKFGATELVDWNVTVEGEKDPEVAASIMDCACEVLRDKES